MIYWLLALLGFALLLGLVGLLVRRGLLAQRSDRDRPKFLSLVFLLKEPRDISRGQFTAACRRAFNLSDQDLENSPVIPMPPPGKFAIKIRSSILGLLCCDHPYVEDPEATAEKIPFAGMKAAMAKHRAWISVDLFAQEIPPDGRQFAYMAIGRLLAEFAADDCLAIYCPETGKLKPCEPDQLATLRSDNPLAALDYEKQAPTIALSEDDPELAAAEAEARRRWPEFVAAFRNPGRRKGFAIKVNLATPTGGGEHIWVEVDAVTATTVSGRLGNDPENLPGKKIGDPVTCSVSDIEDWIYLERREMVGGFTSRLLAARLEDHDK